MTRTITIPANRARSLQPGDEYVDATHGRCRVEDIYEERRCLICGTPHYAGKCADDSCFGYTAILWVARVEPLPSIVIALPGKEAQ